MSRTVKIINLGTLNVVSSNLWTVHEALSHAGKGNFDHDSVVANLSPQQIANPPAYFSGPMLHSATNGKMGQSLIQHAFDTAALWLLSESQPQGLDLARKRVVLAHLLNHPNDALRSNTIAHYGAYMALGIVTADEPWHTIASLPLYPSPSVMTRWANGEIAGKGKAKTVKPAKQTAKRTALRKYTKDWYVKQINRTEGWSVTDKILKSEAQKIHAHITKNAPLPENLARFVPKAKPAQQ